MKNNKVYLFVFLALLSILPSRAKADHGAGAEMLYEWVSDSTYRLYYKFYRDCSGIAEPGSISLFYTNTCDNVIRGITLTKIAALPDGTPNGSEVSPGCSGFPSRCTNSVSALPGYREWWYTAIVTLFARCDHWIFPYALNARNTAITNLQDPSKKDLYVEATLDNLNAQGNSSPSFTVKPVPFICNNIPYRYNNGANDINGDSLYFEMIQPRTTVTGPIPFVAATPPFNLTNNPLQTNNTFNLNHYNGEMSFTPYGTQQAAITLLASEYRNNKLIGTVMRDIQVVVLNCNIPQPNMNIVQSTLSGGTLVDSTIVGCATQPISFCFNAVSPDKSALLVVKDNSKQVLTGASIIYANQKKDSVKGCLSWLPGPTDTGLKIFTISVADSTCRPPGIIVSNTFTVPIYIWPQTVIYPDTAICAGGAVQLHAVGGGSFIWNVLPGGSPLSSLSCIACNDPVATPMVTTRYTVESQIGTICKNRDTVTITVAHPPVFNLGPDTTTCVNSSLQLNVNITSAPGSGVYSIRWLPSTGLNDDTIANPIASLHDNIQYVVTLIPDGIMACSARDTLNVRVLKGFKIDNIDTAICHGDAVQVRGHGDNGYTYTWMPVTHMSDPKQLTPLITPDSSAKYVIAATYPGCTDSVMRFSIEVQPVPVVTTSIDRAVCAGDTLHLTTTVTPLYNKYTYKWLPGSGLNDPNSLSPVFSGVVAGQQKIVVSTPAGCKGNDSLFIHIVKVAFLQISGDTAMCPHDSVQLHIKGDSLTDFYWSPNWYISDTISADPYVSPDRTQYYTVYGMDSNNCLDTAVVLVTVKPQAIMHISDSMLLYPGDSYQIDPETNCSYFTWFPPIGLSSTIISNPVVEPDVNTRYYVEGVTEAGCKVRDSITVTISDDSQIDMPNVFVPGNGPNNIFRVIHLGRAMLKRFTVYNRWGVKMFETMNINDGWDGTLNGQPQPMGVYVYVVEAMTYRGHVVNKRGNITLLR